MEIVIAAEVQTEERGEATRTGRVPRQWLFNCEEGDLGFRLVRSHYQPGDDAFVTPRHHHAFQQIRWAESGSMNFGPEQDVAEGDIAYFPRGTYYGPQRRDHGIGLTLQFGLGSEMLGGKDASRLYREYIGVLRERGTVSSGIFTDTDPVTGQERSRDLIEAIMEEHTGEQYTVPAEGYNTPILIHPSAFEYYETEPGVEIKHLGNFYDHVGPNGDVRISMIRLAPNGTYLLGAERSQLMWSTAPGLYVEGRSYPELTCLYSPRNEEVTISATESVETYIIEFPHEK